MDPHMNEEWRFNLPLLIHSGYKAFLLRVEFYDSSCPHWVSTNSWNVTQSSYPRARKENVFAVALKSYSGRVPQG